MTDMNDLIVVDFETYWSKDVSLSKMTTPAYISHPDFEVQSMAVRLGLQGEIIEVPKHDVAYVVGQIDWARYPLIGHNLKFDAYILRRVLNAPAPPLYLDTLGMARAVIGGMVRSHSLKESLAFYGYQAKQNAHALLNTKGKHWDDMTPDERALLMKYNGEDVADTTILFALLSNEFPSTEWRALSWTVKAFVESPLMLDKAVLTKALKDARRHKRKLVKASGVQGAELRSNPKFAKVLESMGVTPPTKISAVTGKETYAFGKQDEEFTALLEHPDEQVRRVVEARLAVKSTIMETRCKKYLEVAETGLPWPVDLHFSGAHTTHRLSGGSGGGGNPQNLGRGSALREAIVPPPGHAICAVDLSGIEMRAFAWLAGVGKLVADVRNGRDPYCRFASAVFGEPVDHKQAKAEHGEDSEEYKRHKMMRTVGKVAVLSLQYGAGDKTFRNMLRVMGGLNESEDFAQRVVNMYRAEHPEARTFWQTCDNILRWWVDVAQPGDSMQVPPLWPARAIGKDSRGVPFIELPRGLRLRYPSLRRNEDGDFIYKDLKRGSIKDPWIKTYGGRIAENLTQAVARDVIMTKLDRIDAVHPVWMQVHDENILIAPEEEAPRIVEEVNAMMMEKLDWWPDLPLGSEGGYGPNYKEAK